MNKYLDLCTNALSRPTTLMLEAYATSNRPDWPALTVANYEYGAFITVPPSDMDESGNRTDFTEWDYMPDDLVAVLRYATEKGATVIRFDRDTEECEDLPSYDW